MKHPLDFAIWALVALALLIDLWLIRQGRKTTSHRYQARYPTHVDISIMVVLLLVWIFAPLLVVTKVILSALSGHLFWPNKERWH